MAFSASRLDRLSIRSDVRVVESRAHDLELSSHPLTFHPLPPRMITRLSARKTSTFTSVRAPPSPPTDELSLLRWTTSGPPRPPTGARPSALSPSSFSSSLPRPSPFAAPTSLPPPPNPFAPKPSVKSPPPRPTPTSAPIRSKPQLSLPTPPSSPSPPPLAAVAPSSASVVIVPPKRISIPPPLPPPAEVAPTILSRFEQLLATAREQTPMYAYQAKHKPEVVPGMHKRRFKASVVTLGGTRLTSVDLMELGVRLAVMGRLKREFGVLEKVEFGSDPAVFTFPPVPAPTFSFTILHEHPISPNARLTTFVSPTSPSLLGYRLKAQLPLCLASPSPGGPSLYSILQTAAHHPSPILADIHPYSTNHTKVFFDHCETSKPREEPAGRDFFIEIQQDLDWNPSYILDPNATFQTLYEPPVMGGMPESELRMTDFETELWEEGGLGKGFVGFSGGLKAAREALGKRLGRKVGDVGEGWVGGQEVFERRELPRAARSQRGGPFGESPPVVGVMAVPRLKREGGLAGSRTGAVEPEKQEERSGGLSSPFARTTAPHFQASLEPSSQPSPSSLSQAELFSTAPSSDASSPLDASLPTLRPSLTSTTLSDAASSPST